jgi:hypothetical protein
MSVDNPIVREERRRRRSFCNARVHVRLYTAAFIKRAKKRVTAASDVACVDVASGVDVLDDGGH